MIGFDRDPAALARPRAAGAIDEIAPDLAALAERCRDRRARAAGRCRRRGAEPARPHSRSRQLVFDVASVKVPVVAAAPAGSRASSASHPLAGREIGGFARRRRGAVRGPHVGRNARAAIPRRSAPLDELIVALGARPLELDAAATRPARRDRRSHLPQLLSVALGARLAAAATPTAAVPTICAGRGCTRCCGSRIPPPPLWATDRAGKRAVRWRPSCDRRGRALETLAGRARPGRGRRPDVVLRTSRPRRRRARTSRPAAARSLPYAVPRGMTVAQRLLPLDLLPSVLVAGVSSASRPAQSGRRSSQPKLVTTQGPTMRRCRRTRHA